jgi:tRNA 2-thiouridine synthesizing protein A
MANTRKVDLTGVKCPLPILKLNSIMKELDAGDECIATADDPAFCMDVRAWCEIAGHELVSSESTDGHITAVIRKAA